MSGPDRIVAAARGWMGTPYRHQASCKGAGTDCLGLILGVWREVVGALPEDIPPYTPDWSEAGGREDLLMAALRWLEPADTAMAGDVLLFRMRNGAVAKHLGIATETGQPPASSMPILVMRWWKPPCPNPGRGVWPRAFAFLKGPETWQPFFCRRRVPRSGPALAVRFWASPVW